MTRYLRNLLELTIASTKRFFFSNFVLLQLTSVNFIFYLAIKGKNSYSFAVSVEPLRFFTIVFWILSYLLFYHYWLYFPCLFFHVTSNPSWLLRPVKFSTSSELYPDCFPLLSFIGSFVFGVFVFMQRVCVFLHYTIFPKKGDPLPQLVSPGRWKIFLETCRALNCGLNHRPDWPISLI